MENIDFWEMVPEEGKYAMAVKYHRSRTMARIYSKWVLMKDGVL
jgi:hypothetical protein